MRDFWLIKRFSRLGLMFWIIVGTATSQVLYRMFG